MNRELKLKTKESIFVSLVVFFYLLLAVLIIMLEIRHIAIFNGVIMSLQYGLCLLLVYLGRKRGIAISMVLLSISFMLALRAMIMSPNISILPGLCNCLFYIITIVILGRNHQKREAENVSDVLTGLLNRRGLYKFLKEKVGNGEKFSLLYISLDNFKVINDSYGHTYGDELLCKISELMKTFTSARDSVARIGGAEYVVVLTDIGNAEDIANRILETIRKKTTIFIDDIPTDCYLTCYAGVSTFGVDANDYEEAIKHADIAMYEAIAAKSKTAFVFDDEMAEYINRQMAVEKLIKEALADDKFYLVYQPQYDVKTKTIRGVEALLRLKTDSDNPVGPGEFIPVAEKNDLILQIDDYVLRHVMQELKPVVLEHKDIMVSVNISAKNISVDDFSGKVKAILDETGFPPTNLELEITEYCMVESMDTTIDNINKLRSMGIEMALDDFGTGYTSLSYVAKLPINLLKIDKSLIDDIVNKEKSRQFVHTVISLGHLMGCNVISEGVEDETQVEFLKEDGCDYIQGFIWSRPLLLDALVREIG